jgi:hypothetical protein
MELIFWKQVGGRNFYFGLQSMGFKSQEFEVLLKGEKQTFNPVLREAINEMTAVTISAGAMEASDEKRAVVLRPVDIVTVPSAMGDIIGAFQTLPGTPMWEMMEGYLSGEVMPPKQLFL